MKKDEKNSVFELCPIRNVVSRFGGKWSLLLIVVLGEHSPMRFNQIGAAIPDISTKMLAGTLHALEADGLVSRQVFAEVPIRVEYELTELGRSLVPLILQITEWAQTNMDTIIRHRRKYERAAARS